MALTSVAVIHSASPLRDYRILLSVLPERFRDEVDDSNKNETRRVFSLVAASQSTKRVKSDACETILILPSPMASSSRNINSNSSTNGSVKTEGSTINHVEFETVPLTKHSSKTPINSFASLVLANSDELQSAVQRIQESEYLLLIEKEFEVKSDKKSVPISLAKFLLPGRCLVTLSTAAAWSNEEARSLTTEFMTDVLPMTQRLRSDSASTSKSIPPVVETNNNRRNIIPSLATNVLSFDGNYQSLSLNSQIPIPVETELFKGQILLLLKPAEDPAKTDPYWNDKIFSKKKRRIIFQLQGKLKYKPTGTIYAGMEVSDPMKLGLIANGLCNLILKLIRTPTLHYSFGNNTEKAHICFPASTFFETFVVTPPGETPPEMGGLDFEGESPETKTSRKAYKTKIDWNTEDIYSMSFHSMYVDFPTWSIVSLPTGRDLSLQTFWGNSFASIVLYEVDNANAATNKQHTISDTKYLLGVQLKHLGTNGNAENILRPSASAAALEKTISETDYDDEDETTASAYGTELGGEESISSSPIGDTALMPSLDEEDDNELDTTMFFDSIESLPGDDGSVNVTSMDIFSTNSHNTLLSIIDTFCPCWIEMFSRRGKYTTLYAFCGTKQTSRPLFRTEEMVERVFRGTREEDAEIDDRFSHRVSGKERTRRIFGLKYAEAHTMDHTNESPGHINNKRLLRRLHKIPSRYDTVFLRQRKGSSSTLAQLTGHKSGIVARAISDRHWKEERMVFSSDSRYLLFRHIDGSKVHLRIILSNVINVSPFPIDENGDFVPLPTYFYLQIETFARVTMLMFSSKDERDEWAELLEMARHESSSRSNANDLLQFEIPVDDFLSKSTMWNCQKRKILNFRRYSFRTPRSKAPEETLQLAESALTKVLALKPNGTDDSDLRAFLDSVAALKEADAHSLNDEEKCAFFLNVYHIMIMHSYIILGPPSSGGEWISYFNNIAYQCSDDIFSLAELEHNIIRANMSYPSIALSRFVLPKSQYHFALKRSDFRLNFAMNSGSLSMPTPVVPVYKACNLNTELDRVTKQFVGFTVHVKQKGKNDVHVSLPRVCQWFAEDFGPNSSASDVVTAIESYLSEEKRNALRLIWNSKKKSYEIGIFNLKYLPFNYECRFLTGSLDLKDVCCQLRRFSGC